MKDHLAVDAKSGEIKHKKTEIEVAYNSFVTNILADMIKVN